MQPGEVVLLVLLVVADTIRVVYGKTTTAKIGIGFPSLVYITWGAPRSQPMWFNSLWIVLIATWVLSVGVPQAGVKELRDSRHVGSSST